MTAVNRNIVLVMIFFFVTAIGMGLFYPKEEKSTWELKIGAGADISGLILDETIELMDRETAFVGAMEFGDC